MTDPVLVICPTCGGPAIQIEHEVGTAKGGYTELRVQPSWTGADMRHALTRMGYNLDAADMFMANLRAAGFSLSVGLAPETPPENLERGDPPNGDLRTNVRRFVEYVADVRAGRVKRLDRDVVLSLSANMERQL